MPKPSTASASAGEHGEHSTHGSEVHRIRHKIQGNVLQDAGISSNYLWSAAFKMLAIGRSILIPKKPPKPQAPTKATQELKAPSAPEFKTPVWRPLTLTITPLSLKSSNQTISPKVELRRKVSNSLKSGLKSAIALPESPLLSPKDGTANKKQKITFNEPYRKNLPCGFSEDAWRRILASASGADEILSKSQQLSVVRYTMDRGTLDKEQESLGLKQSAQIWKVLERMACLNYEMNA